MKKMGEQESDKLPNKIKVIIIKIRCAPKGFTQGKIHFNNSS